MFEVELWVSQKVTGSGGGVRAEGVVGEELRVRRRGVHVGVCEWVESGRKGEKWTEDEEMDEWSKKREKKVSNKRKEK